MANKKYPEYTQEQIDDALAMLIAFAGNASAAHRELEAQGKRAPVPETLHEWARTTHWERYEELREKYAAKVEGRLVHDMFDTSRQAQDAVRLAVEKAVDKLEKNRDQDPARTASYLAKVSQIGVDKSLAMQGRPSRITENRDATEILRSLIARGIFAAPDATPELESGEDA